MNKKIIALCLVLTLCLTSAVALAASSKTTADVVTVDPATETPVAVTALTEDSRAVLDEIAAIVNAGSDVVAYFDEDVQKEITAVLPAGVQTADLKMDEFIQLALTGDATTGGVVTLTTAAAYSDTDAVITMLCIIVNGEKTWKVLPCTVEDGKLAVTLSADDLLAMQNGTAVVAVLSNKN